MFFIYHSPILICQKKYRNNSNKIFLFNQTSKVIKHIYRVVAGYDMSYDEFRELCRKSLEEDCYYFLLIDIKRENKGDIVFAMRALKNVYRSNTSDEGFLIT